MLQAFFDREGVLNVKPRNHHEAMMLKWFVKEFAIHGARLLNIETDYEEGGSGASGEYQEGERAYGLYDDRQESQEYDQPQYAYDNVIRSIRDFRVERGGQGGRGGSRGDGGYLNPQNTRDRNPNNGR